MKAFRKHSSWYTKCFPDSAPLRQRLMQVLRVEELAEVLAGVERSLAYRPEAMRVPRGKTGGTQRVALPEGYLDHLDDDAEALVAGDIGAAVKLKNTHTGNTLCDRAAPVLLPFPRLPEPLAMVAIKAKGKGDEDKLSNGLQRLHEEDPSFTIKTMLIQAKWPGASAEEMTASVEQLIGSIEVISKNAGESKTQADETVGLAKSGGTTVTEAVNSMRLIQKSASSGKSPRTFTMILSAFVYSWT